MENLTKPVLHVVSDERSRNYKWDENAEFLNPNVDIVSINNLPSLRETCIIPANTNIGSLLIKHPFLANTYVFAENIEYRIYQDKCNAVANIAGLLGAKNATFNITIDTIKSYEASAEGKIDYKVVNIKSEIHKETESKLQNAIKTKFAWDGCDPTKDGYEKAVKWSKENGIYNDVLALLHGRNPENSNKLNCYDIDVKMTEELNELTEFAFSLNVLKGLFKLNASASEQISYKKEAKITFHIEF